ncbi:hypothetical protein GGE16_006374 [Rhizobium leguminosarum]|uniref:Uncharacterized protein n=1 Tax=Rhizobium leguminosarum TaxID=384 RepID=A0AAE2MSU3_RHILE|nr:hypothetical protein [Rhizobium leguminosarum]MBB4436626.1 hypothetical protein [Rhizobium esperanzae]MBB4300931.1 hypothetical protein [Rhizobium leguminosarum]MBB4312080.1 hypothetical protein [Rhizobium leguminosarum]MBB4421363.1 hypothetical protein [Rhizobium leguminosarum]
MLIFEGVGFAGRICGFLSRFVGFAFLRAPEEVTCH